MPKASLSFSVTGMDEEQTGAIHVSLYQVWVYREIIRRTGLLKRADEHGWVWGDPGYFGIDPFQMYSDQLAHALAILDIPLIMVHMQLGDPSDYDPSNSGDKMAPLLEGSEYEPLTEEDFILWFEAKEQEVLDRYELASVRDSGWEGQVVAGVRWEGETVIPLPGEVFPNLLEVDDDQDRLPTDPNCADAAVTNPQRLMTNLMAATCVMVYLHTLLGEGMLLHSRTFFDARRGYVRSDPAVGSMLEVSP